MQPRHNYIPSECLTAAHLLSNACKRSELTISVAVSELAEKWKSPIHWTLVRTKIHIGRNSAHNHIEKNQFIKMFENHCALYLHVDICRLSLSVSVWVRNSVCFVAVNIESHRSCIHFPFSLLSFFLFRSHCFYCGGNVSNRQRIIVTIDASMPGKQWALSMMSKTIKM